MIRPDDLMRGSEEQTRRPADELRVPDAAYLRARLAAGYNYNIPRTYIGETSPCP